MLIANGAWGIGNWELDTERSGVLPFDPSTLRLRSGRRSAQGGAPRFLSPSTTLRINAVVGQDKRSRWVEVYNFRSLEGLSSLFLLH